MKKHKKSKIHPIREQILDIADDVSTNPGSAILTVLIFAGLGVGGFILLKKFVFKKKQEHEQEAAPPSAIQPPAANVPVPLTGDKDLIVSKSYTIQSITTPGSAINIRSGPGVNFEPPIKQLARGNYIVNSKQKDTAGNTWGKIYVRKYTGSAYVPDKEIGWVFSGYLKYIV